MYTYVTYSIYISIYMYIYMYIYIIICVYIYDPEDRAHPPQEDRGTPKGGAFWGRSTEEKRLGLGVAV